MMLFRKMVAGLGVAVLMAASPALAFETVPYTPAALAEAKAAGQPFVLDFFASWCTTCKAQERVIDGLIEQNPAYGEITYMRVNWDEEERGPLVAEMGISRRSTLVVLKGETELGRIVAGTGKDEIAALLNLAL